MSIKRQKLLNFAVLSAWLVACFTLAILAFRLGGVDFRGFYTAARVMLTGGNPYDYHMLAPILEEATGSIGNNPFYYAPWFAWMMIPLGLLPFQPARGLWMVINLVLWIFNLVQLARLFKSTPSGWLRYLLFFLLTLLFAWTTWRFEQAGVLILSFFIGLMHGFKKKQWWLVGMWLALLLIKPNITLLPVLAVNLWLIRKRQWRPLVSMVLLLALFLVFETLISPGWYKPFTQPGFTQGLLLDRGAFGQVIGERINTTLRDWLWMAGLAKPVAGVIASLALGVGLVLLIITTYYLNSFEQVVAASLLINFVITPYALQYDFPPLAILVFWMVSSFRNIGKTWQKYLVMGLSLFILSILFWERPVSDGYWIVLGLTGLACIIQLNTRDSMLVS